MSKLASFSDLFPPELTKEQKQSFTVRSFTSVNKNKILSYLSDGAGLSHAFAMARISNNTKTNWVEKGKVELLDYDAGKIDYLQDYGQFLLNMQAAMASYAHKMRRQTEYLVFQEKDARYAALLVRLLAAEHPEYYVPKQRIEQKTDVVVRYEFDEMDGEEWEQRLLGNSQKKDDSEIIEGEFVADHSTEG